jgi:hypothetical protein
VREIEEYIDGWIEGSIQYADTNRGGSETLAG